MEIAIFSSIITIICSILSIILFFKIWAMTNDVKVIKQSLSEKGLNKKDLLKVIASGDKEKISKALISDCVEEYYKLCDSFNFYSRVDKTVYTNEGIVHVNVYFAQEYAPIIEKYEKEFAKYGLSMPQALKELEYVDTKE